MTVRAKMEQLLEKSAPPKPPGEGWQMVFGRWVQTGFKAKGKDEPEKKPEAPKKKKFKEKAKAKIKRAAEKLKAKGKAVAKGIKDLPGNTKKLVTDKAYRTKVGKDAAALLKRKAKGAVDHVKHEVKEFKLAGAAIKKKAQGKELDDHDKKAIKAVVKTIATTVAGTLAMGGVAHLTAAALGQHFAIETAAKAVGKAALYASMFVEEEDEAAFNMWVEKMVRDIAAQVEKLGEMSEDDLVSIIEKYQNGD